jgi:hypothetical protein
LLRPSKAWKIEDENEEDDEDDFQGLEKLDVKSSNAWKNRGRRLPMSGKQAAL